MQNTLFSLVIWISNMVLCYDDDIVHILNEMGVLGDIYQVIAYKQYPRFELHVMVYDMRMHKNDILHWVCVIPTYLIDCEGFN